MEEADAAQVDSAAKLKALFASEQQRLQYHPPKLPAPTKVYTDSKQEEVLHSAELPEIICTSQYSGLQEQHSNCSISIVGGGTQFPHIVVQSISRIPVLDLLLTDCLSLMPEKDHWAVLRTIGHSLKAKFPSADDWVDFARVYVYARYQTQRDSFKTIFQDVVLPEDNLKEIQHGDAVQVTYTMSRGPLFHETETSVTSAKLEIGFGHSGLEEGIKGMHKGGRRLIVLRVNNNKPSKDAKLYDLTMVRVRRKKSTAIGEVEKNTKAEENSNYSEASSNVEDSKKESISDRLARMARTGAAINLNVFGAPSYKTKDSEYSSDSLESTQNQESERNVDQSQTKDIEASQDIKQSQNVDKHLELLEDIKESQACISKAVLDMSSKLERIPYLKTDKDLEYMENIHGDESSCEEDNIVESIARMIAENRELKRRIFDIQTRRIFHATDSALPAKLAQIMQSISKEVENEMNSGDMDSSTRSRILNTLEQNLTRAASTILEVIQGQTSYSPH